jgi:hypothetical protein
MGSITAMGQIALLLMLQLQLHKRWLRSDRPSAIARQQKRDRMATEEGRSHGCSWAEMNMTVALGFGFAEGWGWRRAITLPKLSESFAKKATALLRPALAWPWWGDHIASACLQSPCD